MRTWQVLQRPVPVGRDPDVILVKDGICWPSLFVPLLWALARQQWLFALVLLAASLLLVLVPFAVPVPPLVDLVLAAPVNVFAALFANDWRVWRMEAAGYRVVGVVAARNLEMAERRWFTEFAAEEGLVARPRSRDGWMPLLGEA